MRCFQLDINVMCADNLKAVTLFNKKPKAFVEVCAGDPGTKYRTRVVRGRNNHRWDHCFSFPIDATALNSRCLVLDIKSKSFLLGVGDVGWVMFRLKELFDAADAAAERVVEHQVYGPSGEPSGTVRFSYKFWDKIAVPAYRDNVGAVTGTPPGPGYGYGGPTQTAYGHAPATYGYARPPRPRRRLKKFVLSVAEHLGMRWAVDYMMPDAGEYAPIFGDADVDF